MELFRFILMILLCFVILGTSLAGGAGILAAILNVSTLVGGVIFAAVVGICIGILVYVEVKQAPAEE